VLRGGCAGLVWGHVTTTLGIMLHKPPSSSPTDELVGTGAKPASPANEGDNDSVTHSVTPPEDDDSHDSDYNQTGTSTAGTSNCISVQCTTPLCG
jgi:hypothetical protein